jgi:hypothetical protein
MLLFSECLYPFLRRILATSADVLGAVWHYYYRHLDVLSISINRLNQYIKIYS